MWINYNTSIFESKEQSFSLQDLSCTLLYEEIAIKFSKIMFFEAHYFRMMSSMRIMRMSIPLSFTPDFILLEVKKIIQKNSFLEGLLQFIFFEKNEKIHFLILPISTKKIPFWSNAALRIDIFQDYKIHADLLSTLSFFADPKKRLASAYINEYCLDEVVFLNQKNRLTQGLKGCLFIVNAERLLTPKIEEGVTKTVLRSKFLEYLVKENMYDIQEVELSICELHNADEIFFLQNFEIRSVSSYKKKDYASVCSYKIFQVFRNRLFLEFC